MKDARATNRVRLVMITLSLAAIALGSFWLLEVMRRSTGEDVAAMSKGEPDYVVDKFSFVRMSKTGVARYSVSGTKLIHYPDKDSFEVQQPVVHSLNDKRLLTTMRAQRAIVEEETNKIHLYHEVQVERQASAASERFHLASDYLLVLPDDDVMQTDKSVDIIYGRSHLTGVGMYVNNATRELRLSRNVHGTFQPPVR
jgi:lipopolysaccharide export system protein LptC